MLKEIRLLKKELSTEQAVVRSQYMTSKTKVGSGFGSALGGALFGKLAIGKLNSARRDDLRRAQLSAMQPYDAMKRLMDGVIAKLDQAKLQIELSPEFQNRETWTPSEGAVPPALPPPLPVPEEAFFLYLDEQVKGPFSTHQVEGFLSAKLVDETTLICPAGQETWLSIFEVPPFAAESS